MRLVDLMPSLCAYLQLACPAPIFGRSFLPAPDRASRYLVSEGVMDRPRNRTIRTPSWKLVFEPAAGPAGDSSGTPWSLYDLRSDPGEARNLLAGEPGGRARRVAEVLRERLAESVPPFEGPEAETAPLDPELEKRLEELGYVE